ncbi:Sialin [Halotydeus destructor]|nr:Sialin [Halotydeus destructor]
MAEHVNSVVIERSSPHSNPSASKSTYDNISDDKEDSTDESDSPTQRLIKGNPKKCSKGLGLPARFVFAFLGFLGFNMIYALRVNLSVAIVSMVNSTATEVANQTSSQCFNRTALHIIRDQEVGQSAGEFYWDSYTQGLILGSFFWGYIITQVPGGRLAEKFGSKKLLGFAVFFTSLLTIISPFMARWNYVAFMVTRALMGMFEGVSFPSMHCMVARWFPKTERGLLSTFIYSGAQIGTVIAMPLTGLMASWPALGGWAGAFWLQGLLGIVWFGAWMTMVYETPSQHPRISRTELKLILDGQGTEKVQMNPSLPWKKVLTSVPLWALVVAHAGNNWGFYTILFQLPTYFSTILGFDLKKNSFLSALPYLLQASVGYIVGFFFEYLMKNNLLETNTIRKLSNTIGFLGPALCLYGVTLVKCDAILSVLLFILAMGFNGFIYSGFYVTHVDMAPDFAGTLMGITNCIATIPGILAPYVVGLFLKHDVSLETWAMIFYISSLIYVISAVIFLLFGSARLQPWGLAKMNEPHVVA